MKSKKNIIGILGLPINENGEFLITKRIDDNPALHHKWQIAGGGMEFGETAEQTLHREMKEELGVRVEILHPYPITHVHTWNFEDRGIHVFLVVYLIKILDDQSIELNEEASEFIWTSAQTVDATNSLPSTKIILEKAQLLVESLKQPGFVFSNS